jgi:hypothetical protein
VWNCLERRLKAAATGLTPAQILHSLKQILLVESVVRSTQGRSNLSTSYYSPEKEQPLTLDHWAGLCPSNHCPKSTATKTNLCRQPEGLKEFEGADSGGFEGSEISPAPAGEQTGVLCEDPPERGKCRGRSNQAWAAAYARSVKQFEARRGGRPGLKDTNKKRPFDGIEI